jgi:RNA polymerase sigma factor (sigma-70 family)
MKQTDESAIPAIEDLRAGDERVWAVFFGHFDGLIRSIVEWPRWHFDAHICEDVAQLIKLAIVQSIGRLESQQSLQAFVKKICFHRCIDMLRKQLREQERLIPMGRQGEEGEWEELDFAAGAEFDPVAALQRAERAAILRTALLQLDEASRDCLNQFYVDGLTYKEMAQVQGVSVNTVGSRLSRCLDKLRGVLEKMEVAP